jgi:hypothetical protein
MVALLLHLLRFCLDSDHICQYSGPGCVGIVASFFHSGEIFTGMTSLCEMGLFTDSVVHP